MLLKSYFFKRITIVGVGLMGGSLGMTIKKHKLAKEVIGLSHRQSSLSEAIKREAIDTGYIDVKKAIQNADLVVLATPVNEIIKLLSTIAPHLRRHCIITDIGSTKTAIVDEAEKVLPHPQNFVGSHPLAGLEKKGVIHATNDLYEGSVCLTTSTKKTSQMVKEKIKQFWTRIGAEVKDFPPEEHDELLSYTSHLPHLLAFGLMEAVPQECLAYVSQGLKDTTRIAASSPQMWNDICLSNAKNTLKALDEFVRCLSHLRKAISEKDQKSLMQHFTKAKEKRDTIA